MTTWQNSARSENLWKIDRILRPFIARLLQFFERRSERGLGGLLCRSDILMYRENRFVALAKSGHDTIQERRASFAGLLVKGAAEYLMHIIA